MSGALPGNARVTGDVTLEPASPKSVYDDSALRIGSVNDATLPRVDADMVCLVSEEEHQVARADF